MRDLIEISAPADAPGHRGEFTPKSKKEREAAIRQLEQEMQKASKMLEFEYAAVLRDRIIELRGQEKK